jgi:predicted secreted protein
MFRSNAYELLGFDILVDTNMKPWLLEVNHAPNLEPHTTIETRVKVHYQTKQMTNLKMFSSS